MGALPANLAAGEELIRKAIALDASEARYYHDLGLVLSAQGKSDEALAAFERVVSIKPDFVEAWNNLGTLLKAKGKLQPATEAYQRAVTLLPTCAEGYYNLGNVLKEQRLYDEAIAAYREAIALRPNFSQAHCNLGAALKEVGNLNESCLATQRALEIRPDPIAASNLLCTLHYFDGCTPQQLFEAHAQYERAFGKPLSALAEKPTNDFSPERRLRIGYVSADFSQHPVGRCLLSVLRYHDHGQFEIFCYSDVRRPDSITEQTRSCADSWRDVATTRDDDLARLIRSDRIDVLIDLASHTNENRLPVFARKPAPVQITWLGMPTTTGESVCLAMDYRLSDPYLDPPGQQPWPIPERTVLLPNCFWPYESSSTVAQVNDLPAIANGFITFGCFNNFCKVSNSTLSLWARTLLAVPRSRLLILAPRSEARTRLTTFMQAQVEDAGRIEFIDRQPHEAYLQLYGRIDICLDTIPYSGHTTTLDALWMGVPVVTMYGPLPFSRGGLSILSNVGLAHLAANSVDAYAKIVAELAADIPALFTLRGTLRSRLNASPIMNGRQYAADLEHAIRQIWRMRCGS